MGYGAGVKGYRIWYDNKIILSRNVVFNESSMLKAKEKISDIAEKEIVAEEVEVQFVPQENQASMLVKNQLPQPVADEQDTYQFETVLPKTGSDEVVHQIVALDRPRMVGVRPPARYRFDDLVGYALQVDNNEPSSYKAAISGTFAISVVSRYMVNPGKEHWQAVKRIFRRSMIGYVFTLGGSVISWKAILQPSITLSTTEAEYMALTEAAKERIWLKVLVNDLSLRQYQALVYCDSLSAICLTKDQVHHEKTKHIDVRNHFLSNENRIQVKKVGTVDNRVDMFTKPVA
ncbi:hypothetical protein AXG93_4332s1190 [Marchantia polymorpha subsp. ruderalis]|uniref:Retroviral polymerase SH3-like domain-containing protein n=1 Tax=Marchantia polymorpha subsp. ruderalis TaxID=1480154 RepID=A0A176W3N7_MARPO|nr:hypothetical protein AXG93_4332s1190 [Marchantia polymorpha subsp. ruderalis]